MVNDGSTFDETCIIDKLINFETELLSILITSRFLNG